MKNAIILHGKPSKEEYYNPAILSPSNSHWLPWVQSQLVKHDIAAVTPEIPHAYNPQWELWKKEVERFDITADTLIVGHSCGGGFWIRWLSEHPDVKVGKVVLVAPSLGYGWENREQFFGAFTIDPYMALRTRGLYIFHSDDDMESIQKSVAEVKAQVPSIDMREFKGYGHFTESSMKTVEFPELVDELLAP